MAGTGSSLGFNLTSAKASLSSAGSFVTFLMDVDDPDMVDTITLEDLFYQVNHLEFDIEPISTGTAQYEASNWLTFVPPLSMAYAAPTIDQSAIDGATAEVPIPLRAYPTMPTFKGQSATSTASSLAGDDVATALAQSKQWTYGVTYTHEHVAQDEVNLTIDFNVAPVGSSFDATAQSDIVTPLANYIHVADQLWALLAYYSDPAAGDPTTAGAAAQSLASVVQAVADAWDGYWLPGGVEAVAPRGAGGATPVAPAQFSIEMNCVETGKDVDLNSITLHKIAAASWGPVDAATGQEIMPAITYAATGQASITLTPPATPDPATTDRLVYAFGDPPQSTAGAALTFTWAGLDIVAVQNAGAELSVSRNVDLISGIGTNPAFIFQTGDIKTPHAITPLNEWREAIDITSLGTTVTAALAALLTTVFATAPGAVNATIGLSYAFGVAPSDDGGAELLAYHPIGLFPNCMLSAPYDAIAGAIAQKLSSWQTENGGASANGKWVFSLTFTSNAVPEANRPLLVLEHLIYDLAGA